MEDERKKQMQGHRQRVRDEIIRSGLTELPDYRILEYLLFFAIPRKDTKPIAYRLIAKYGSLSGVMDAPVERLAEEKEMTLNAAILLHSLPDVCNVYVKQRLKTNKIYSAGQIVPYVRSIAPKGKETLFIVCLDEKNNFICGEDLFEGKTAYVRIEPQDLLSRALALKAKKIILAHNHPSDKLQPSKDDVSSTLKLKRMCETVGVELIDHVIIGNSGMFSFLQDGRIL